MAVLCWLNTIQHSPVAVSYPCTSCLLPAFNDPSVTCLRLSHVSIICHDTYSQFLIQSAFLPYIGHQAAPALRRTIGFDMQYRTADVAENLGRYLSCAECTVQGNDFELILTVKVETKHPVEGQFGSEFSAICNHCRVMVACSCKTWKFCE